MSFVPVTGPAVFKAADPPREGVVGFTDGRRTVTLPIRGALPVLTRGAGRDEAHPSVRLIAGAALLGMRLVAAGSFEPAEGRWRPAPRRPTTTRHVGWPVTTPRPYGWCTTWSPPWSTPCPAARPSPTRVTRSSRTPFHERLERRLRLHDPEARPEEERDLAQLVRIALRIEADEEELVAGSVRVVPQVHDEQDPLRFCDAALLWTGEGRRPRLRRARPHPRRASRCARAADAWPVLDRLLELRVPDQITLDTDELVSLLDEGVDRAGRPRGRRAVAAQPGPRPHRHRRARPAPRPARRPARSRCRPGC